MPLMGGMYGHGALGAIDPTLDCYKYCPNFGNPVLSPSYFSPELTYDILTEYSWTTTSAAVFTALSARHG